MKQAMQTVSTAAGGFMVGIAVARLLDPRSGASRRAVILEKGAHGLHELTDFADKASRDLRNRSRGIWHAFTGDGGAVPDEILVERVRSKLGRVCSHPGAIAVSANDGCVELRGPVLAAEHRQILEAIADVPGVCAIDDDLERHERTDDVPALQGGAGRQDPPEPELLQVNWAPGTRLVVGTAGAALIGWGASRRGLAGIGIAGIGALLVARATANLPLARLIGVRGGRRVIDVQKSIFIAAPPDELYRFFAAAENFPRFMEHVREVRITGDGRWHWRVEGPGGIDVGWEAEVTRAEPGRLLSWRTVPNATVESSGTVFFAPVEGGTRIDVRLTYNPPLGAIGHGFAALLESDPKKQLDDDLMRLKSLVERGKATGRDERVTRDELL